ncbi:hypothetical protein ACFX2I_024527 [Malus domestica]|uniref:Uncharacterized protein n=1 Tax=Malus domestica TaxID=3750 RepID=A0A498H895_MALDO|nr:hypothetical protein DVH24_027733 [Malus domestica]
MLQLMSRARPTTPPSASRATATSTSATLSAAATPLYNFVNSAADSVPIVKSTIKFLDNRYFDVDGEIEASSDEVENEMAINV